MGLQSMLPRGTITHQRMNGTGSSTIDLVLMSEGLARHVTRCQTYPTEYGSDHKAIETTININYPTRKPKQGRWKLDEADWPSVSRAVKNNIGLLHHILNARELELQANSLTKGVTAGL